LQNCPVPQSASDAQPDPPDGTHSFEDAPHAPLVHSAAPTATEHVPLLCSVSGFTSATPFPSFVAQASVDPLQNCPAVQSPSAAQPLPPDGTHLFDAAPHAPLVHSAAPTGAEHVPLLCSVSGVTSATPFPSFVAHVSVDPLQNFPVPQSPSDAQPDPPEGMHAFEAVPQTPLVHSAVPIATEHVPLLWSASGVTRATPLASFVVHVSVVPLQNCPELQSPSASQPEPPEGMHLFDAVPQTPLVHTAVPTAGEEQLPLRTGEWFAIVGIAVPVASLLTQPCADVSQNCAALHIVSSVQPDADPLIDCTRRPVYEPPEFSTWNVSVFVPAVNAAWFGPIDALVRPPKPIVPLTTVVPFRVTLTLSSEASCMAIVAVSGFAVAGIANVIV
jgi:hypothetical protein